VRTWSFGLDTSENTPTPLLGRFFRWSSWVLMCVLGLRWRLALLGVGGLEHVILSISFSSFGRVSVFLCVL